MLPQLFGTPNDRSKIGRSGSSGSPSPATEAAQPRRREALCSHCPSRLGHLPTRRTDPGWRQPRLEANRARSCRILRRPVRCFGVGQGFRRPISRCCLGSDSEGNAPVPRSDGGTSTTPSATVRGWIDTYLGAYCPSHSANGDMAIGRPGNRLTLALPTSGRPASARLRPWWRGASHVLRRLSPLPSTS
jgi:hypothetical protein